MLENCLGK